MVSNGRKQKLYKGVKVYSGIMREEIALVEVDVRGRVQIPLPMRKVLGIQAGDILQIKVSISKAKNEMSQAHPQMAQVRELVLA